jgi:hypothetical protein
MEIRLGSDILESWATHRTEPEDILPTPSRYRR